MADHERRRWLCDVDGDRVEHAHFDQIDGVEDEQILAGFFERNIVDQKPYLHTAVGGADLQRLGLTALDEVGVLVDEQQRAVVSGSSARDVATRPELFAAGDVVADRPRTALEAIYAGIGAARAVCRVRASQP